MDIQDKSAPGHGGAQQIASDMSEAVSYLIGVARAAGLEAVARKLNDVNIELRELKLIQLDLSIDAKKDEGPEQRPAVKH
jgi:hypothetical protein